MLFLMLLLLLLLFISRVVSEIFKNKSGKKKERERKFTFHFLFLFVSYMFLFFRYYCIFSSLLSVNYIDEKEINIYKCLNLKEKKRHIPKTNTHAHILVAHTNFYLFLIL